MPINTLVGNLRGAPYVDDKHAVGALANDLDREDRQSWIYQFIPWRISASEEDTPGLRSHHQPYWSFCHAPGIIFGLPATRTIALFTYRVHIYTSTSFICSIFRSADLSLQRSIDPTIIWVIDWLTGWWI